ncbi:hypothetical protein ACQ4PT_026477 [Festuca glaucescens]
MASRANVEFVSLVLGYIFTGALYLSPVYDSCLRLCVSSSCQIMRVRVSRKLNRSSSPCLPSQTDHPGHLQGRQRWAIQGRYVPSCLVWLQYGLTPPLSRAIIIINAIGIAIEGTYIGIYLRMATVPIRRRIFMALVLIISILGMIASVIFPLVNDPHRPLGVMGDLASVAMYAGPARQLRAVWTTKDVRNMSFCVAAASLCSGISWTTYAGLIGDWYILVPNAIGILLALVQLIFYVVIKYFYQAPGAADAGVAAEAGAGAGVPAEAGAA